MFLRGVHRKHMSRRKQVGGKQQKAGSDGSGGTRAGGAHRKVRALRSVAISVGMAPVSDEDARLLQRRLT